MKGRLKGKRALITGAASGIGRATALLLAREGARVAVTDLDEAGAQRVAEEIRAVGGEALALTLDVTDEAAWEAIMQAVTEAWGGLEILVPNAGIPLGKPVTETSLAEWRRVMAVNVDGVFLAVKHALPLMRRGGGGSIVILSSAAGLKGMPNASAYCTSKGAVRLFAKSVALECAAQGDGVRVNSVHPGGVETPIWEKSGMWEPLLRRHGSAEAVWEALGQSVPLKRFGTADEIAHAVLYLASDEAAYITGTELVIDGGFSA
jgi:NAD(P)-dependent dehydrogenase (short-subunit alcohol dehydrogenase family)